MFSLINIIVVRAGLEPATHGFSVRKQPNENVDGIDSSKNRGRNRGHLAEISVRLQTCQQDIERIADGTHGEYEQSILADALHAVRANLRALERLSSCPHSFRS